MPLYKLGSKGPEIERVQARLKQLGRYQGPVDGTFGSGTESAVRAFQRDAGLTADGKVGTKTWARLFAGGEAPAQPDAVPVGSPLPTPATALQPQGTVGGASTDPNNPVVGRINRASLQSGMGAAGAPRAVEWGLKITF